MMAYKCRECKVILIGDEEFIELHRRQHRREYSIEGSVDKWRRNLLR
jgi:hypothetical protein